MPKKNKIVFVGSVLNFFRTMIIDNSAHKKVVEST